MAPLGVVKERTVSQPLVTTAAAARKILVVDVGGTHVKVALTGRAEIWKLPSGKKLTARRMARDVRRAVGGEKYDVVSIGYPGVVVHGRPAIEPFNLGKGWVQFDFGKAFGKPVRVINDAAMQALGSYRGGRMLFLGVGTGLGSAMVVDGAVQAMELAHLPFKNGKTYEDYAGKRGRKRLGDKKWRKNVFEILACLRGALEPDDVVIGGGNAEHLGALPSGVRLGDNANAFVGGARLWEELGQLGKHELSRTAKPRRAPAA
jgi:predicted NBD/HSP70 family sugar kinase